MGKSFWECLKPNKINMILMIAGYGIWYIFGTIAYLPLSLLYFTEPEGEITPIPFALTIFTLFLDMAVFYLIGTFAYWLVYYFEGSGSEFD